MKWSTPGDLADQVLRRWNRGEILAARARGENLFPLALKLKRPGPRDVADRFGEVQDWARALIRESRETQGFGFELRFATLRNRVQGANAVPVAATIPTEADALWLIRRQEEANRFQELVAMSLGRRPELREWLARRALTALEHVDRWEQVLAVLDWFAANQQVLQPRGPGMYLRQLDIPGVDTKFIESRRGLMAELLDIVLPTTVGDRTALGPHGFSRRYGLLSEPPLIRFRFLDPACYIRGLSDLSLPPDQFAAMKSPVRRVFITENRTNGLAFPDCARAMVVFGLGYGLERLAEVAWLHDRNVFYWGDIDTHGFGILDRLRGILPSAESFLMDRETLEAHRPLWGQEPDDSRCVGELSRLTPDENATFDDLRHDRLGDRVRLEQERIRYASVREVLGRIADRAE